jgi:glucokinase
MSDHKLEDLDKAIIGVAAPILGDKVIFVNVNLEFSISQTRRKLFSSGLLVVNDLELQGYAISSLKTSDLSYIGEPKLSDGAKILIAPGTGLGLAGIVNGNVVATEAGHINISDKISRPDLKKIMDRFMSDFKRVPTYEDFLSGKGITYFYSSLTENADNALSSEDILSNRKDTYCLQVINLLNYLLSSYLRYMALVWGANGGVLLSGSIVNSLLLEEDYQEFRKTFEDSETMGDFMQSTPLAIVNIENIGFVGGLELSKKLLVS